MSHKSFVLRVFHAFYQFVTAFKLSLVVKIHKPTNQPTNQPNKQTNKVTDIYLIVATMNFILC